VGEQDLTNLAEDGYVFRWRIDVLSFEWMIFASLHSWTSNRGGSHTQVGVYPPPSQGEGIQTGIWRVSKPPSQLASELLVQASQAAAEIAELSCSIMDPAKR